MLVLKHTEDQSKFTQVVHWWFNIKKHPILFQIMTREKVGGLVKYLVTVGQTFQAIFIQNNYDFSTGSKKQTKVRKISCLLLQKIMCTAFQTNNYFRFCEIFIFKSKYYLWFNVTQPCWIQNLQWFNTKNLESTQRERITTKFGFTNG